MVPKIAVSEINVDEVPIIEGEVILVRINQKTYAEKIVVIASIYK
jgi:hypothetical protein